MMNVPKTYKVIAVSAVLVAVGGIVLHFLNPSPEQSANPPTDFAQESKSAPAKNFPIRRQLSVSADEIPIHPDDESADPMKVSREKIEEYLKLHNRDAASLLAAFHASGDKDNPADINYLKEAAANFPDDPHVQFTVLAQWTSLEQRAFPEDRRKWLDAFKASSPSNSLANYLSAQDYFKNKQPDVAFKELVEATGKSQFAVYTMESYLGAEELSRFSGKTTLFANPEASTAVASDLLSTLANLKGVAQGIGDGQKQYLDAGDTASVERLAQMGMGLANRLTSGEGGRFMISHLVGIATENIALKPLDQNTSYDFLGGKTPSQRLDENKQQKAVFRELSVSFGAVYPTLTEVERASYAERVKIYGELEAMRWLKAKQGPP